MPRPRVHPDQRRRVAQACTICRDAKKRCSGTAPCSLCVRRGTEQRCVIAKPRSAAGGGDPAQGSGGISPGGIVHIAEGDDDDDEMPVGTILVSPNILESANERAGFDGRSEDQRNETAPSQHASWLQGGDVMLEVRPDAGSSFGQLSEHQSHDSSSEATSSVSAGLHSRMLLNSRGEQVYIGGAASLSFLQLVRSIVTDQIGPTQFSHNSSSRVMLEKGSTQSTSSASVPPLSSDMDLDADLRRQYYQSYVTVTNGFVNIFTRQETLEFLENSATSASITPRRRATRRMIIAIGAQCKSAASARDIGQLYFRKAQADAHVDMLEEPDMDVVRSFLLMAFYLLGDCRRNAAFMYLGIARQSAVALGLHSQDLYRDLDDQDTIWRLRVWTSLLIVDMTVNSILGRPSPIPGLSSGTQTSLQDLLKRNPGEDQLSRLIASHHIVSIISEIADTLSKKTHIPTTAVLRLMDKVQAWSRTFADCLQSPGQKPSSRTLSDDGAELQSNRNNSRVIGNVHVSCLYYFAVILVTRPVFIASITGQSSGSRDHAQSQLASACLDASIYLIQTCLDVKKMDLLYGNMCILKALVFAAGLALGIEMFARRSTESDVETAFDGARDVLKFMSGQSPQASHYYEILTLLSNAIAKQRHNRATTGGRSKYVSRVFTLQGTGKEQRIQEPAIEPESRGPLSIFTPLAISATDTVVPDLTEEALQNQWLGLGADPPAIEQGDLGLSWDDLDLSRWDNFPHIT